MQAPQSVARLVPLLSLSLFLSHQLVSINQFHLKIYFKQERIGLKYHHMTEQQTPHQFLMQRPQQIKGSWRGYEEDESDMMDRVIGFENRERVKRQKRSPQITGMNASKVVMFMLCSL